jgi:hypothetical protein
LTVSQVLEAIDQELEDVAAPDEARHQARRWLWQARTHLPQSDDGAAGALAEATQRALGLAGIEEPAHRR